jgi:hypothetical protein
LLAAFALRRSARIQAPFCALHREHWRLRLIGMCVTTVVALVASIGCFYYFVKLQEMRPRPPLAELVVPWLCVGMAVTPITWLVIFATLRETAIRADEITETHILLNGVSNVFVEAVEEAEIERRVRLRQWEVAEAIERAPHEGSASGDRAPPSTDAFEERGRSWPTPPPDAFQE